MRAYGDELGRTPPTVTLPRSGTLMPQIGFGLFLVEPAEATRVVNDAIEVGYRHFDTASAYGNEAQLGAALRNSGLRREDLFVTTKLWNDDQGRERATTALHRSLDALGLASIDLYLIHWPAPARGLFIETWEAMQDLVASGEVKTAGVSNFLPEHLQAITAAGLPLPSVNQIELHPAFQQLDSRSFMREHDVQVESWAPLGHGAYDLQDLQPLVSIAAAHDKSVQQVVLRWHLQEGLVVIPKSTRKTRMAANFDVVDFELTREEIDSIRALDRGLRVGTDPREKN